MDAKPTAICTYLPAVTLAGLAEAVSARETEATKRRKYYDAKVSEYQADRPHCTDDLIRLMEQRGQCGIEGMYSLLSSYKHWQDADRMLQHAREMLRRTRPTPAKIKIAVIDSFAVKDQLKGSGYRFERDGHWIDPFGLRVKAAWVKVIDAEDLTIDLQAHFAHLEYCGVTVQMDSDVNAVATRVKHTISLQTQ